MIFLVESWSITVAHHQKQLPAWLYSPPPQKKSRSAFFPACVRARGSWSEETSEKERGSETRVKQKKSRMNKKLLKCLPREEKKKENGHPREACPPAPSMHGRGPVPPPQLEHEGASVLHVSGAGSRGGQRTSAPHQETLWASARSLSLFL